MNLDLNKELYSGFIKLYNYKVEGFGKKVRI